MKLSALLRNMKKGMRETAEVLEGYEGTLQRKGSGKIIQAGTLKQWVKRMLQELFTEHVDY